MLRPRSLDTTYHSEMYVSMLLQRKNFTTTLKKPLGWKKTISFLTIPKQKWTNLSVIITFWASLAKYHFHHEWQWLLTSSLLLHKSQPKQEQKDWMQTLPCEHHLQSTYNTIYSSLTSSVFWVLKSTSKSAEMFWANNYTKSYILSFCHISRSNVNPHKWVTLAPMTISWS